MEKQKVLLILIIAVLFSNILFAQVQDTSGNLSYSISLDKKSYLPLEPIIVISKLKNIGNEVIEVNEPCAVKFIVNFNIYRVEPNSLEEQTGRVTGHPAGPKKFVLEPNDICQGSSELHLTNSPVMKYPGLEPGEYIVKSKYHLKKYSTENYNKDIILSEASFSIKERDAEQEKVFQEFSQCINDVSGLAAFIEKYPKSPYNQYVLEKLSIELYQQKKHREEIHIYEQMLEGSISSYRRERILHGIASTYLLLGDVNGAIKRLSNEKKPSLVMLRERLEQGIIPNEYKEAVEKANEEENSQETKQ